MSKKTQEVAIRPSEEALALLRNSYPVEQGFNRIILPRLGMHSQDKTEGKGKAMKVVSEAGEFYTEKESDEENEEGKKVWKKTEIGTSAEGIILFQRKQLRLYDESTEQYTSSPVYDSEDQVIPLFCDKKEVARGTPAELKAKYMYTDKQGKKKSALEENRILYVLNSADGEVYQMNLRGSSMWSFVSYTRKLLVPSVLTSFSSEAKENGDIAWNMMTFTKVRDLDANEVADVIKRVTEIKEAVLAERAFYASAEVETKKADDELDELVKDAQKALD